MVALCHALIANPQPRNAYLLWDKRRVVCDEHSSVAGGRHHGSGVLVEIRSIPDPSMRMSPEFASVKNFGDEREKIVDLCATLQRVKVPETGEGSTI